MRQRTAPDGSWDQAAARPHPRLRPGVLGYLGFRFDLAEPRARLELPDGAVSLVVLFEAPGMLRISGVDGVGGADGVKRSLRPGGMLSGLRTGARLGVHDGRLFGIEVMLTPWTAHAVLGGIPMRTLTDRGVDLVDLLGPAAERLRERLAGAADWAARFAVLDRELTARLLRGPEADPRVLWAWRTLNRSGGRVGIRELARSTGWTERHLQKRFGEQIGLAPKAVGRIARLQLALRMLDAGRGPAVVADACGFFDQAHFNREFRAMTGRSPLVFVAERVGGRGRLEGPGGADRVSGQVTSAVLRVGTGS